MMTDQQRAAWEHDGFFILPSFANAGVCKAMHTRAVELARAAGGAGMSGSSFVQPESKANPGHEPENGHEPEKSVSKIFKLHRDEPTYRSFIQGEPVLDLAAELIGPSLDSFLSQFIFKNAGALGQPWHQDSYYFRFDRSPQVGIWLAVTEATLENGCLYVLPGSHREPVHEHVLDSRPGANLGYVEIVDHDMAGAVPVTMKPGDLLVFHSHLMHRSVDNQSSGLRAAMVYHLAEAGTTDRDAKPVPINDWMPVRRRIETQVDIDAPVERVRETLLDAAGYTDWNPYLVQIDGSLEAGADIIAHGRSEGGDTLTMPVHVVSVDEDSMRWEGGLPDRGQFKGDHRFEWEAQGPSRTRLHHTEVFTGGLVGDIIVPRIATIRSNFERMNEALRRNCEAA